MSTEGFYDLLAPDYHLVYDDWKASVDRQGQDLHRLIRRLGCPGSKVLDVACGIGTQALGLARQGYLLTCSDLSTAAVTRARDEARRQGTSIDFEVADMRAIRPGQKSAFDIVLCADNSLPHLLSESEILVALRSFLARLRPRGCCLISLRDYATATRGGVALVPHGVRSAGATNRIVFQTWSWHGDLYDATLYITTHTAGDEPQTRSMTTTYFAVSIDRVIDLMKTAGFAAVTRHDDSFFQPIISARAP